jgi:hypothetical protein
MNDFSGLGRALVFVGLLLAAVGLLLTSSGKVPWLGRLPGDVYIKRERFSFYFPIGTSLLLSVLLTILFHLFGRR